MNGLLNNIIYRTYKVLRWSQILCGNVKYVFYSKINISGRRQKSVGTVVTSSAGW